MERHHVHRVSLRNFRNYQAVDLELSAGFHVLNGNNGQGKTNFLEALYLLSSTRLLRGIRDVEAIREGDSKASVTAEQASTTVAMSLETGTRKRAFLNGLALPRASDLIGRLPSVCISTADMAIVRGEPSDRRFFLDMELSQAHASYLRHFSLYKRALEQRNALLKHAVDHYVAAESFEPWEIQLAHHGSQIRQMRGTYICELHAIAQEIHAYLGDGEPSSLQYEPKDAYIEEPDLLEAYQRFRDQDKYRKTTSIGPHRDEMRIEIQGREARIFGSQGQQRSAVLALKFGTFRLLRERLGFTPLLLLDDILSDLDVNRRFKLTKWVLDNAEQAILTCTEAESAGSEVLERAVVYRVEGGKLSQ